MSNACAKLLAFLKNSPTPFHACQNLCDMFAAAGYRALDEGEDWQLEAGQNYFYTRADSAFVAFKFRQGLEQDGIRLVGTHTDSPCLKVKPEPELSGQGFLRLGVEVYGGVLLNPWFDRDLSMAGKISGLNDRGKLESALVDFKRAVATIPSLAIHLNREANKNKTVNAQKELNALLAYSDDQNFRELLIEEARRQNPDLDIEQVLDFNISFYDTQEPAVIGLNNDFIASARLDNLLSTYIGAAAMLASDADKSAVLICNDHEEIGSRTDAGAQGTMLKDLLARMLPDAAQRQSAQRKSFLMSIDNAHGIHPNYPDKHDQNHGPILGKGPVIKFNANQSYATSSDSSATVRWLAKSGEHEIPLQSFAMRADMACGSTIGPLTASNVGIPTVDIGVAQFAMHSIRELAAVQDVDAMQELVQRFLASTLSS
jgi:aspartyl aminopeptidase